MPTRDRRGSSGEKKGASNVQLSQDLMILPQHPLLPRSLIRPPTGSPMLDFMHHIALPAAAPINKVRGAAQTIRTEPALGAAQAMLAPAASAQQHREHLALSQHAAAVQQQLTLVAFTPQSLVPLQGSAQSDKVETKSISSVDLGVSFQALRRVAVAAAEGGGSTPRRIGAELRASSSSDQEASVTTAASDDQMFAQILRRLRKDAVAEAEAAAVLKDAAGEGPSEKSNATAGGDADLEETPPEAAAAAQTLVSERESLDRLSREQLIDLVVDLKRQLAHF